MVLVGDNSLVQCLRILTSLELFFNSDYYPQHPFFLTLVNEHSQYFRIIDNLLPKSISEESLDSGKTKQDLVKQEAILNCNDKKWSSFLCILGLSSVLGRNIHTYYPNCGEERYKVFLNGIVKPRLPTKEALDDLTASKMPLSQPILNKAPNETFSSAAAFQVSTSKVLEPAKSLPTAEIVDKDLKVNSCEFDVSLYREKVKGLNQLKLVI